MHEKPPLNLYYLVLRSLKVIFINIGNYYGLCYLFYCEYDCYQIDWYSMLVDDYEAIENCVRTV